MCGIAGYLNFGTNQLPDSTIALMTDAIRHRGPDGQGAWADHELDIALGHRRLSIIDLSPAGSQPMVSHCGRYVIVFNGEIYNYKELRTRLESEGGEIRFRGHSDTEVWLAAISRWGLMDALQAANGMFAIALWDRQTRTMHLACDRMGEKPLYYGWLGSHFVFGSELKSLMAHPAWKGEIDRNALALFMRRNYVPAPFSIFQNIRKLEPATVATLEWSRARAGPYEPELRQFWSIRHAVEFSIGQRMRLSDLDADSEFCRLFEDSVRLRMEADVPLGAFLSGGFDSTAVVAVMQTLSRRPVKTFTIGFSEQGYDEAPAARAIAKHLGTEHTEAYLSPRETMDVIPRLSKLYDEPFADNSQIPTLLVAQLARERVTVALSGDAGDEALGGYRHYGYANTVDELSRWWPAGVRNAVSNALRTASKWRHGSGDQTLALVGTGDRFQKLADIFAGRLLSERADVLVKTPFEPAHSPPSVSTTMPAGLGLVERMMYQDTTQYLPGDILTKVDRASMAVSLEARIPFLDHRLVEFAWRLPLQMKIGRGEGKLILRKLVHRYVPPGLMARPKSGFTVPIGKWLRGSLRDWAASLLEPERLKTEGYLNPKSVASLWNAHLSGHSDRGSALWAVIMFQCWLHEYGNH